MWFINRVGIFLGRETRCATLSAEWGMINIESLNSGRLRKRIGEILKVY